MRITQQNIVQNNINVSQSQITPKEAKALIGSIIEGRISAVQGQQLATLTMGDKQLNVNIKGLNLQENQLVNLKITGYKDGALIAKLVSGGMQSDVNHSLTDILSKLGITDQPENVSILEAMKTANIPITKDNFMMMRQGMSEVKALISELSKTGQMPLGDALEMPIKALALKIMQQNGTSGGLSQASNMPTNAATNSINNVGIGNPTGAIPSEAQTDHQALNKSTQNPVNAGNIAITGNPIDEIKTANIVNATNSTNTSNTANNANAANVANAANAANASNVANTTNAANTTVGANVPAELESSQEIKSALSNAIQHAFDKDGTLKQGIQALLGQFDYNQESLILKNEVPITLKNIFLAYDALSDEGGISNRFSEVLRGLESVPFSKESVLNMINVLTSEVSQEEKLESLLDTLRKELPDSEIRQGLERELSVIKESTTLSKTLNDQMMFMQMPIPINDQVQNVDIYYKKNKKKPDPEDLTLLIALKTFNFGEVRCVVHKQAQNYSLSFSFKDETSQTYFESKKEQLTMALSMHKDKQFSLTFTVKSNLPEFQIRDESELESFGFDLKV